MNVILETICKRRAVKVFDPVEISGEIREQILDATRHAPSSFNSQPYRLYWVETAKQRTAVAKLCMGQMPAETASALVVVVADIARERAEAVSASLDGALAVELDLASEASVVAMFETVMRRFGRLDVLDTGHLAWEEASGEYGAIIAAWVNGGYLAGGAGMGRS